MYYWRRRCYDGNKVKGIRAGVAYNQTVARLMREHNDANVMTMGAKFTTFEQAKKRVDIFLKAEFAMAGMHRVKMMEDLENGVKLSHSNRDKNKSRFFIAKFIFSSP